LPNYWLCVTNEANWNVVKAKKVWGVPQKRGKRQIEAVKPGDLLAFYVTPKRIGGIFEVTSEPFESKEKIFSWADFGREEFFPYRVKLKPIVAAKEPVPADKLIRKLSFSKGQKRWSVFLRRAMLRIVKSDYDSFYVFLSK
jgi:predicted RNA-binding protein